MEAYLSLYPNPIFRVEESPFTDADDPVITKAYYLGLISGFPDGTFRPDIPITREQFFKITVNFLSVCGYPYEDSPSTSLDHFTDAGELSSYALPCARLLVELGIVKGDGKQLLPKSSTQCQQALAMFFRSYLTLQAWMEDSVDPDGPAGGGCVGGICPAVCGLQLHLGWQRPLHRFRLLRLCLVRLHP